MQTITSFVSNLMNKGPERPLSDLEKAQQVMDSLQKESQEQLNRKLKTRQDFLSQDFLKESIDEVINSSNKKDQVSEEAILMMKRALLLEYASYELEKITKYITELLSKSLKNINFRVDFEGVFSKIKKANPSAERIFSDLDNLEKNPKFSKEYEESKAFRDINSFMITLTKALSDCLDRIFIDLKFDDHYDDDKLEILRKIEEKIHDSFKKKYSNLYKELEQLIKNEIQASKTYIKDIIKESIGHPQFLTKKQSKVKSEVEILKFITQRFEKMLQQYYQLSNNVPISNLIYTKYLDEVITFAKTEYQQQFILLKPKYIYIRSEVFKQIMNNIHHNIFTLPFRQEEEKDFVSLLFYILKIRTESERTQITSLFFYLDSLGIITYDSDSQLMQEILNIGIKDSEGVRFNPLYQIEERMGKYISFLKHLSESNSNKFYTHLLHLYMIVSNIQVKEEKGNQISIDILPYYGFFYDLRSRIIEQLYESLHLSEISLFFNFLDRYFEEKSVYFSQNQGQIFQSLITEKNYDDKQHTEITEILRNDYNKKEYSKKLEEAFYEKFSEIKRDLNLPIPNEFYLVRVSPPEIRSRNVIIAISGFTSEKEDKQLKWKKLGDLYPNSEVFALQYKSQSEEDLKKSILETITPFLLPVGRVIKLSMAAFQLFKVKNEGSFTKASTEAVSCGKFLAHLIYKGFFLPNSSISLVGFSLGTHVIQELLIEYKSLIDRDNAPSMIASVALMGGVACIDTFKNERLIEVVSHKLYNCYSANDGVLTYIYRVTAFLKKPAGLNKITFKQYSEMSKVVNTNFTKQIFGHEQFMLNHESVLQQIDFRQEFMDNSVESVFERQNNSL